MSKLRMLNELVFNAEPFCLYCVDLVLDKRVVWNRKIWFDQVVQYDFITYMLYLPLHGWIDLLSHIPSW